jgi:hypothetical protein
LALNPLDRVLVPFVTIAASARDNDVLEDIRASASDWDDVVQVALAATFGRAPTIRARGPVSHEELEDVGGFRQVAPVVLESQFSKEVVLSEAGSVASVVGGSVLLHAVRIRGLPRLRPRDGGVSMTRSARSPDRACALRICLAARFYLSRELAFF